MTASAAAQGAGNAPAVLLASQLSATSFQVVFSEPMTSGGITNSANYTLTANGSSAARTITGVTLLTLSSVAVSVNAQLSIGPSAYTVTVNNVADIVGNSINVAANSANLSVVGTSGIARSRDGGSYLTVTLPAIVSPGRYRIHVGPTGTSADPRGFSIVRGEAEFVRLAVGQTSVAIALPSVISPGLGRAVTFIAIDPSASPSTFQSLTFVDFLPRQYFSSVLSLRRLFPSRYDIGFIDLSNEVAQ